ncbi:MAG: MFS transporter [Actinomycetota bacterium]|nr:MFS transporter [Actinomycetota bacterium]
MRGIHSYLRSLDPALPRPVWLLQVGGLGNAFGNGIVLPFLLIYLHNVRGMALGVAGLIAATNSAAALGSGFLAGTLSDRIGPRRVLIGALLVMAVAIALFPLIREPWHAFALNALLGSGSGAFWPSQSSLLTTLSPAARRHAAFAVQRVTMNLGIALGGLTGGLIASTAHPGTFTVLFVLDAATFVGYALVLVRLRSPARTLSGRDAGRYGDVIRDRAFMRYVILNAAFMAAAMAVIVELLPPFAKNEAHVSEKGVGLLWFVNSLVIVLGQLPVAKLAEGRRRMPALALMGLVWAASMVLIGAAGLWLEAAGATAVMALAVAVFGIGACLHGTIHGPLSADLAPPELVGRYMAFSSQSWQVGWIIGPAIGGFMLEHQPHALWPLAAAVNVAAAGAALSLERRLPHSARRTPAGETARLRAAEA